MFLHAGLLKVSESVYSYIPMQPTLQPVLLMSEIMVDTGDTIIFPNEKAGFARSPAFYVLIRFLFLFGLVVSILSFARTFMTHVSAKPSRKYALML